LEEKEIKSICFARMHLCEAKFTVKHLGFETS